MLVLTACGDDADTATPAETTAAPTTTAAPLVPPPGLGARFPATSPYSGAVLPFVLLAHRAEDAAAAAEYAAVLRLGGPAEFPDRVDTQGLDEAYGGFVPTFKEFKPLGTGALRYDALQNGEVDVIVAFGTDGRIAGDQLVVLQDDKAFYPIYNIAPVVRMDTLTANPGIADALNAVAPLLKKSAAEVRTLFEEIGRQAADEDEGPAPDA